MAGVLYFIRPTVPEMSTQPGPQLTSPKAPHVLSPSLHLKLAANIPALVVGVKRALLFLALCSGVPPGRLVETPCLPNALSPVLSIYLDSKSSAVSFFVCLCGFHLNPFGCFMFGPPCPALHSLFGFLVYKLPRLSRLPFTDWSVCRNYSYILLILSF